MGQECMELYRSERNIIMAESNKNPGQATLGTQGQGQQGQGKQNQGNQGSFAQGNFGKGGQQNPGGQQGQQGTQNQGSSVAQTARDAASSLGKGASELMHSAADQAQHAAETVGGGMRSLAGTIREKAPHEGVIGTAAGSVAGTLETSGRYLQEEGFSGMVDDVARAVRQRPIACMLCCVAVGFIVGRLLTSSSHPSRSF